MQTTHKSSTNQMEAITPMFKRPIIGRRVVHSETEAPPGPLVRANMGPTTQDIRAMIADGRLILTSEEKGKKVYELDRSRLGMVPVSPPEPIAPLAPYIEKKEEVIEDELVRPIVKRKLSALEKKINQRPIKKLSRPKM